MRILRTFIFTVFAVLLMTACQNEEDQSSPINLPKETTVKFELDASVIKYDIVNNTGLKFSPTYSKGGFNILAFKRVVDGTDYVYEKTISLSDMIYSGNKLVGNAQLNIGTYKFISAYGVNQSGILSIPGWNGETLSDNLAMEYNGLGALNEIFLQDGGVSSLGSYDLGLSSNTNHTVTATLKRAVSRVDIMFLKGKKNGSSYIEQPYSDGGNVFGGKSLQTLQLRYTDLNAKMNFFGGLIPDASINAHINISDLAGKVTIGTAGVTVIGEDDYTRYDNIGVGDLIKGAAHIFGNYVIPNADASKTAELEVYIKPEGGEGRTISIANKLPMERNKVTLVKIYVVDNEGDEEPNVFTTNVNFEVEIVTAWDGSHEVAGEIN